MIEETNEIKIKTQVRKTHCFKCKKGINSHQYDECEDCRGIICSCGTCFCEWREIGNDY